MYIGAKARLAELIEIQKFFKGAAMFFAGGAATVLFVWGEYNTPPLFGVLFVAAILCAIGAARIKSHVESLQRTIKALEQAIYHENFSLLTMKSVNKEEEFLECLGKKSVVRILFNT